MTKYYVDSCIWLNLLNKEQEKVQGLPIWKITKLFLEQHQKNIVFTKCVRKEILDKSKQKENAIFLDRFQEEKINEEEMSLARQIESKEQYALSFFDCIHLAVCINKNYILITRDQELLDRGKQYITIRKPEDILY